MPILSRILSTMIFCVASASQVAHAAEITMIGSNAMKEIIVELVPAFESTSGH